MPREFSAGIPWPQEAGHIALVVDGEVHSLVTNQEYKRAHFGNMGIVAGALSGLVGPIQRPVRATAALLPLKPWFAETAYTGPIQATNFSRRAMACHRVQLRLGITATPVISHARELGRDTSAYRGGVAPDVRFRVDRAFGASLTLAGYGYPFVQLGAAGADPC